MRPTIAYTVFALVFAGCAKSTQEEILLPECRNFQSAIEDKSVNIGRHFEAAFDALRGITNSDRRAACYVRWVDDLCKLDVSNLDYLRQRYCIREVLEATCRGYWMVDEYRISDSWMEVFIDSCLKGLSWGWKQIDRLKPTMPTGSSYDYGKIGESTQWNSSEYSQWRHCYSTAWWSCQNALAAIEGSHFDSICRGRAVSAVARERAKKKIEEFLGRKMRSEEECLRANEAEREKMKAVRDGKVGPDLKKLRPAEMRE